MACAGEVGRFKCVFAQDLNPALVGRFRAGFEREGKAAKLVDDMFGLVDQLLCAQARVCRSAWARNTLSLSLCVCAPELERLSRVRHMC